MRTKQLIALLFLLIVLPAPAQEPSAETKTVTIKWAGQGSGVIYRNGENVGKTPVSVELNQGDLVTSDFYLSYVFVNGSDLTFSFNSENNLLLVNDHPYGIYIESEETPIPAKLQGRPVRTILFDHSISPSESQLNTRLSAEVVGISVNSPFTQEVWKEKDEFELPLLSDFNREAIEAYDVKRDELLGLQNVASRAAFVIDQEGVIQFSWESEDPSKLPPFDEIQETVESL